MPIRIACPNGHSLTVKSALAGKTGKCPKCGAAVQIPAVATTDPGDSAFVDVDEEWAGLDEPIDEYGTSRPAADFDSAANRPAKGQGDPALPWKVASGVLAASTLVLGTLYFSAPAAVPAPNGPAVVRGGPPAPESNGPSGGLPSRNAADADADATPAGGGAASVAPSSDAAEGGTPQAAALEAAQYLEDGDFVAFFRRLMPAAEFERSGRRGRSLEEEITKMVLDRPEEAERLKQMAPFFRRVATVEPEMRSKNIAVFRVPIAEAEEARELPPPDAAKVMQGTPEGYGDDLAVVLQSATDALQAGSFDKFVVAMYPAPEAMRLQSDAGAMAGVTAAMQDRPDAVEAFVRDFEAMAGLTPEMNGKEATYTIPGDVAGGEDRRVVLQQDAKGNWRFYDAATQRRREIGELVRNYTPPPPPTIEVPFIRSEGVWRLSSDDIFRELQ